MIKTRLLRDPPPETDPSFLATTEKILLQMLTYYTLGQFK